MVVLHTSPHHNAITHHFKIVLGYGFRISEAQRKDIFRLLQVRHIYCHKRLTHFFEAKRESAFPLL